MTSVVGRSGQYWSAFSPANVPGLALWYDFSDPTTFDLSGDYVITRVRDKSGNGRHGTASNAATGNWIYDGVSKGATRLPERVAVNFALDVCFNASAPFFSGAVALTGIGTSTGSYVVAPIEAGGLALRHTGRQYSVGTTASFVGSGPTSAVDAWSTSVGSFSGGRTYTVVANGVNYAQGNTGAVNPPQIRGGVGLKIGTYVGAADFNFGEYHELLLFSNGLSATDRGAIEDYLVRKWMIPYTSTITSPTSISGCTLWLDTSGGASNFTFGTGSNIVKWNDKSGNNYDVSTSGTSFPVWSDASGYVYFNGTSIMNTDAPVPPTGEETGFVVGLKYANAANLSIVGAQAGGTGPIRLIRTAGSSNYNLAQSNGSINVNPIYTSNIVSLTAPQVLMWESKGGEVITKISGLSTFYTGSNWSVATNSVGKTALGPAIHGFKEIILFNRSLSWPEMSNVEAYLFNKWGLSNIKTFAAPRLNTTFSNRPTFSRNIQFPYDIPDCMLWLDAKDASTFVLDSSGGILKWRDKSGLQNDLSSTIVTGINRPVYSNETVTLNSNRLNVCNSLMSASNFIMYPGLTSSEHTLIAVHRPLTTTGDNTGNTNLFDFSVSGALTCNVAFPTMSSTTPRGWTWAGNAALSKTGSTLLENSVSTDYNIISAAISTLRQQIYKNGVLQIDLCAQAISAYTFNTTTAITAIGRWGKSNASYYQGDVKELFVFNRTLSEYEVNQMETYLATKWSLTNLLPSNHMAFTKIPQVVSSFNPNAFALANVWLDAAYFAPNHSNNQTITSNWVNWGSNRTITFTRTGTPVYISNAHRGRPGVDVASGTFYASNGFGSSGASFATYAVVSSNASSGTTNSIFVSYAVSSTSNQRHRIGTTASTIIATIDNSSGTIVGRVEQFVSNVTGTAGRTIPYLVEAISSSNLLRLAQNGSPVYDTSSYASITNISFNLMGIGRSTTTSTPTFNGRIHEILVYDNPVELSEDDKLKIRTYLMNKWSITNSNYVPTYYPLKGTQV